MLAASVRLLQAAFSLRPFWSPGGADASCKRPRVSGRGFGRAYKSTTRNELDTISLGPAAVSERLEVRVSRMTLAYRERMKVADRPFACPIPVPLGVLHPSR